MVQSSPNRNNVRLSVFDVDVLRFIYPEWDALEKKEKLKLIKYISPEALRRVETHNVTCVGLHEGLAKSVDPETNYSDEANKFVFGDDDSSFSSSDTSLNNKVGEVGISDTSLDLSSEEVTYTTFVDSTELNGNTLSEIGIETSDGNLWNHADISPNISKTSSETVVAEIFLTFSDT